ncbi:hypothetical protein Patl1_28807 [Pistacia atlantica]|uniref:Uncharacterized protein n=1 Tax=Pistacia atlantica TaxID=434234 RepID=A0ACC1BGI2_9ROSI|nr:hypothetical protein Patl1_28807 [Pistacia atlantica]
MLQPPTIMDPLILLSSLVALSMFMYYLYQSKKPITHKTARCSVPEVGGAWPIIGHMHLFGGRKLIYRTLSDMADNYGSVFTIWLGSHKALVVSKWEIAKEIFTVHDSAFSSRPNMAASKLLCYDYAMFGFAPYGPYWREMRKIITVELLSNYKLDMFKHIRASEVQTSIKELYKTYLSRSSTEGGVLVEMKQWFKDLSYNVILRMVAGRRLSGSSDDGDKERSRRCQNLITDFFYLLGVFVLSDAVPSLGWLDFGGYKKAMKRTAKELDALAGEWLEEHKQRRLLGGETKEEYDFMDFMMTILEEAKMPSFDADTIYKATCLNLVAASDSNMVVLTWALSLLLNNPHVLKKAQDELDIHVGKDRHVEESDIKNLVYLQAIVKETFRVQPPAPVIPRSADKDCTLSNGYHVAAGTRLMLNDTDLRGLNFELIPFGCGRRSCAGIQLALQVVHLTLASLLQSFEVMKPSNDPVDMTQSPGLLNEKVTPLEVLITPRLDSKLYINLLALSICIYQSYQSKKPITHKTTRCGVPEAGGAWPIIGHMHLFGGRKLIYRTLSEMADNYGSVFTIRLGQTLAASKLLCYDYAMFGFAPYGPYWREMRKIITVELLSNDKLDMFKHIRALEVQTSIKELYKTYLSRSSTESGVLVEMKQWFKDLTFNVTLRMVAGRRFSGSGDDEEKGRARHCQKLINNFFYLFGVFVLSDAIPSLGWLDFGGYKKAMKKTAKELDAPCWRMAGGA